MENGLWKPKIIQIKLSMNWKKASKVSANCSYERDTQWGKKLSLSLMFVELLILKMVIVNLQMGLIYGCPVEELLTGLAIQCRLEITLL